MHYSNMIRSIKVWMWFAVKNMLYIQGTNQNYHYSHMKTRMIIPFWFTDTKTGERVLVKFKKISADDDLIPLPICQTSHNSSVDLQAYLPSCLMSYLLLTGWRLTEIPVGYKTSIRLGTNIWGYSFEQCKYDRFGLQRGNQNYSDKPWS